MNTSAIGWTDYSGGNLNFVTGCSPVSEGCANCYARCIYERFGRDFSQVTFHEYKLGRALTMRLPQYSPKRGSPHRPMCFVCDTGDLFHESIQSKDVMWAFYALEERKDVIWQVLTKRPERMLLETRRWCDVNGMDSLPANVWLGITAETRERLAERYPLLVQTPARVRFLSIEPMLEPMAEAVYNNMSTLGPVDWIICGAESGPRRRPFDVQWAVDLYERCREMGIPFFGKQDSGIRPGVPLVLGDYGIVQEWPDRT